MFSARKLKQSSYICVDHEVGTIFLGTLERLETNGSQPDTPYTYKSGALVIQKRVGRWMNVWKNKRLQKLASLTHARLLATSTHRNNETSTHKSHVVTTTYEEVENSLPLWRKSVFRLKVETIFLKVWGPRSWNNLLSQTGSNVWRRIETRYTIDLKVGRSRDPKRCRTLRERMLK